MIAAGRESVNVQTLIFNLGVAAAAVGLTPLFKKLAIEDGATPTGVALFPVVIAAGVSVAFLATKQPSRMACVLGRPHRSSLMILGISATGMVAILVAFALVGTTATNRSLFQAAYPAATLILARFMLGERLAPPQYAGLALMIAGLFLMNGIGNGVSLDSGFWLLALTLPLIGFSDVYSKRLTENLAPLVIAVGRSFYGALFIGCMVPILGIPILPGFSVWAWLAAAGVAQALGVWAIAGALNIGKASMVAGFVAASPLVTVVLETWLLSLDLSGLQWFGMSLVIGAAVWLAHLQSDDI